MKPKTVPRERVSLRLPCDLASWLRKRAAERHLTVSAIIEDCVRAAMVEEKMELLLRACLEGVSRTLVQDGDIRQVKVSLLKAAKGEMERAHADNEG